MVQHEYAGEGLAGATAQGRYCMASQGAALHYDDVGPMGPDKVTCRDVIADRGDHRDVTAGIDHPAQGFPGQRLAADDDDA
ncbi:hypothetical protein ACIRLA_13555 [Streptomyces sp. NPDC102364]|uniref:hypothetical protein n=1 Tax=unclassified Streptomyces TaxID=2593676 RepID=UPI0038308679